MQIFTSNAERQRAYRERQRAKSAGTQDGAEPTAEESPAHGTATLRALTIVNAVGQRVWVLDSDSGGAPRLTAFDSEERAAFIIGVTGPEPFVAAVVDRGRVRATNAPDRTWVPIYTPRNVGGGFHQWLLRIIAAIR